MCVCVCICMCACLRACVCGREGGGSVRPSDGGWVGGWVGARMRACACACARGSVCVCVRETERGYNSLQYKKPYITLYSILFYYITLHYFT